MDKRVAADVELSGAVAFADTTLSLRAEFEAAQPLMKRFLLVTQFRASGMARSKRCQQLQDVTRRHLCEAFRQLASQKESRIEEGRSMPDDVHMLIAMWLRHAVSYVVACSKGKSVGAGLRLRHPAGAAVSQCWRRCEIEPFSSGAPSFQCATSISSRAASPVRILAYCLAHCGVGGVAQSRIAANIRGRGGLCDDATAILFATPARRGMGLETDLFVCAPREVIEDLFDHHGIFDARDRLDRATAMLADRDGEGQDARSNPAAFATELLSSADATAGTVCKVNALRPWWGPSAMR